MFLSLACTHDKDLQEYDQGTFMSREEEEANYHFGFSELLKSLGFSALLFNRKGKGYKSGIYTKIILPPCYSIPWKNLSLAYD